MTRSLTLTASASLVLFGALALSQIPRAGGANEAGDLKVVERGRYLVSIMGCADCHTPMKMGAAGPEPDMTMMLAGHPQGFKVSTPPTLTEPWIAALTGSMTAWAGPWGISYSMNLTPDMETGLGQWTESEFIAMARSGRHRGRGRPVLPPMPVISLQNLTDEDLHALFVYLRSIPAISNKVPEPVAPTQGSAGS
jgi:mono/diheme cytochrome c family protein